MPTKKFVKEVHAAAVTKVPRSVAEITVDGRVPSEVFVLLSDCRKALELTEQLVERMPHSAWRAASQLSMLAAGVSGLLDNTAVVKFKALLPSKRATNKAFEAMMNWTDYTATMREGLEADMTHSKLLAEQEKAGAARAVAEKQAAAKTVQATKTLAKSKRV